MSSERGKTSPVTAALAAAAVLVLAGLGVWAFDASQNIVWVGSNDLEVEFLVVDANTKLPIPEARVDIQFLAGSYDGAEEDVKRRNMSLRTDVTGKAVRECRSSRTSGRSSGLGFKNIRNVLPPEWAVRASAVGYETTEWRSTRFENVGTSNQVGPGKDRLQIRFELKPAAVVE